MFFAEIPFIIWVIIFVVGLGIDVIIFLSGEHRDEKGYGNLMFGEYAFMMGLFLYDVAKIAMDTVSNTYTWKDKLTDYELNVYLIRFFGLFLIICGVSSFFMGIYQRVSDKSKVPLSKGEIEAELSDFEKSLKSEPKAALEIMLADTANYSEEETKAIKKELSNRSASDASTSKMSSFEDSLKSKTTFALKFMLGDDTGTYSDEEIEAIKKELSNREN